MVFMAILKVMLVVVVGRVGVITTWLLFPCVILIGRVPKKEKKKKQLAKCTRQKREAEKKYQQHYSLGQTMTRCTRTLPLHTLLLMVLSIQEYQHTWGSLLKCLRRGIDLVRKEEWKEGREGGETNCKRSRKSK
jgi:hypothetical protein